MAKLIDGKGIAAEVRADIKKRAAEFAAETGVTPGLAVIIVGDNPASQVYVRNKKKACEEAGFYSEVIEMAGDTTMPELLGKIEELKNDSRVHGILVQLPLPKGLDEDAVIAAIPLVPIYLVLYRRKIRHKNRTIIYLLFSIYLSTRTLLYRK